MPLILKNNEITASRRPIAGGKAYALAEIARQGLCVPKSISVTTEAYQVFVRGQGLMERIQLELNRKKFADMRWEEVWDAALRIRSMFLKQEVPSALAEEITRAVEDYFGDRPVAVRSSAPDEDAAGSSFAGLHESYINIRGSASVVEHVRLVWASLWSDAALLYRREIGLDPASSAMAVVIQELVAGDRSGVAFSVAPGDRDQIVIEAVHGLNQGLVDGAVEPDRWFVAREGMRLVRHDPVKRGRWMQAVDSGVELCDLPAELMERAPLAESEAVLVANAALILEKFWQAPQDVEWTFRENELLVLQARPITTAADSAAGDKRPWYLSLRRSLDNLKKLRGRIENELLPAMDAAAEQMAGLQPQTLDDRALATAIEERREVHAKWRAVYWDDFIPFAHGMRIFGQFYNDALKPANPYEFVDLLSGESLLAGERNVMLEELAAMVRAEPGLAKGGQESPGGGHRQFDDLLRTFLEKFGSPTCSLVDARGCEADAAEVLRIVSTLASRPAIRKRGEHKDRKGLEDRFFSHFSHPAARSQAAEMLDLGRASFRLRDDDNIHLGRIEQHYMRFVQEGRKRLAGRGIVESLRIEPDEVVHALRDPGYTPVVPTMAASPEKSDDRVRARQLLGQPAGPGIARGRARVVRTPEDLAGLQEGEILVCDAIDPGMTYMVPLSAGIVERRGGMLIHGAIIAREYGIACVTGVPEAVERIRTGDLLTVDGYLGIVTVSREPAVDEPAK